MKLQVAGLWIISLITTAVPSFGQNYNLTDLGVVAGNNNSSGGGLNAQGHAVGTSSLLTVPVNGNNGVATLFSNGQAVSLGTFGSSDETNATGINDLGEVAGIHCPTNVTPPTICDAIVSSNGVLKDINSASLFPQGSFAMAISNFGVAGYGWVNVNASHAFLFANGTMTDLGTLGGNSSLAYDINNNGQIVGWAHTAAGTQHAFLHANGQMTDLGLLAGASGGRASAISANGQIAGWFDFSTSEHIAQFSNGAWNDLGTGVAGTVHPFVFGINDSGNIVGAATIPGFFISKKNRKPSVPIGFIFRGGSFIDLNTLIPANTGFHVTGAVAINNAGQILCNATINGSNLGLEHAVLLTPQ
jgi:probable HAF family extracellular repeat protein